MQPENLQLNLHYLDDLPGHRKPRPEVLKTSRMNRTKSSFYRILSWSGNWLWLWGKNRSKSLLTSSTGAFSNMPTRPSTLEQLQKSRAAMGLRRFAAEGGTQVASR